MYLPVATSCTLAIPDTLLWLLQASSKCHHTKQT